MSYSPGGHKESEMIEHLKHTHTTHTHTHTHTHTEAKVGVISFTCN